MAKFLTKKLFGILITPLVLVAIQAEASSGMSPVWVFMIDGDYSEARMSSKAEQDDYDGVTHGAVVSKLEVRRSSKNILPKNLTFETAAVCSRFGDRLPVRIQCSNASGPFSRVIYEITSEYFTDDYGDNLEKVIQGKIKFKKTVGKVNWNEYAAGRKLLQKFATIDGGAAPFGIWGFSVLTCTYGCDSDQTPKMMIEITLTGD